jgi:hypothetical protein
MSTATLLRIQNLPPDERRAANALCWTKPGTILPQSADLKIAYRAVLQV